MNDFYINIADTNICIKPMYEAVYEFCKDYMCEECEADFTVETTPEDIAFERAQLPSASVRFTGLFKQ